jgi:hypothetical protein
VSIQLLSTPAQLRTALKRLIATAERIDVLARAFDDPEITERLAAAAARGAVVNVTTNLDEATAPDAIDRLREAGVNVGSFAPAEHRRRPIRRFNPGAFVFDSATEWWTAAIVGSFSATRASIDDDLEFATLVESDDFTEGDRDGAYLSDVLRWADSLSHEPADEKALRRHRRAWEAAQDGARTAKHGARRAAKAPAAPSAQLVEPKPVAASYASPISWQELRRCDWGAYWRALVVADEVAGPRRRHSLCGPDGWLFGIEAAHAAYRRGPDEWGRVDVRDALLGRTTATALLGGATGDALAARWLEEPDLRRAVFDATEHCIVDPSRVAMREALAPIVGTFGVSVADLSRILAAAAPDRFFSIADDAMRLRLANIVGFELGAGPDALQDQLERYLDAIEMVRGFPWADATSAERTSDHPRESDAWEKRVALLGCLTV